MKGSRIAAVAILLAAGAWIASGHFMPHAKEAPADEKPRDAAEAVKRMRVAINATNPEPHSRRLALSGRTEADQKVMAVARTSGIVEDIKVKRGQAVKAGDVIAILSDEARKAQVAQSRALVAQRKADLEAKRRLIEKGLMPKLDLGSLEALYEASQATLAVAEAERDRSVVTAPWSGVIDDVPTRIGQGVAPGTELARIIAPEPMLAIAEVAERDLGRLEVGSHAEVRLVTGVKVAGRVHFISRAASPATRTYRVEIAVPNPDGKIPDGITAEISIRLSPMLASRVPRSALTFSSAGDLGVRVVDQETVGFLPVDLVEDEQDHLWVTGIGPDAKVIIQGQDFVREGQRVEAVPSSAYSAAVK